MLAAVQAAMLSLLHSLGKFECSRFQFQKSTGILVELSAGIISQYNYAATCMRCSWLAYLCCTALCSMSVCPKRDKGRSFPSSKILPHLVEVG